MKAEISYFSNIQKSELKTELRSVNFVLSGIGTISILLKFWKYFWPQSHRSSVWSSVLVWGNVPMSCLLAIRAWNWNFNGYSTLQLRKTWISRIFELAPNVFVILGAPFWAPKCRKCYSHKLQQKLKIFHIYHFCSKCASFDNQTQYAKCN